MRAKAAAARSLRLGACAIARVNHGDPRATQDSFWILLNDIQSVLRAEGTRGWGAATAGWILARSFEPIERDEGCHVVRG
jgi:hypothetical protein